MSQPKVRPSARWVGQGRFLALPDQHRARQLQALQLLRGKLQPGLSPMRPPEL